MKKTYLCNKKKIISIIMRRLLLMILALMLTIGVQAAMVVSDNYRGTR